jgi:hypothetical protein
VINFGRPIASLDFPQEHTATAKLSLLAPHQPGSWIINLRGAEYHHVQSLLGYHAL